MSVVVFAYTSLVPNVIFFLCLFSTTYNHQHHHHHHHSQQYIEVPEKRIEGPCEIHVFVLEVDFDFEALAAVADGRLPVRSFPQPPFHYCALRFTITPSPCPSKTPSYYWFSPCSYDCLSLLLGGTLVTTRLHQPC